MPSTRISPDQNTDPQATVPVLTIDGPSGSGKGTISRAVAYRLGWHYLDSGALYRAVGLAANWSFEGNGNDQRTNNPVQIFGGGFVAGKEGNGLYLPSESYARASNSAALEVGSGRGFTLDAWSTPA